GVRKPIFCAGPAARSSASRTKTRDWALDRKGPVALHGKDLIVLPAMRANHPLSRIAYQVMWDRLISVVEEQAQTLVRTAFGTPTREAGDLSAGVYDTEGRMLAQAVTGTPGHVNSMAEAVLHFMAEISRDEMF